MSLHSVKLRPLPIFVPPTASGKRRYVLQVLPRLAMFMFVLALAAQANHVTAFTGTWKLDIPRSTFSPGPAPKNVTVTNAPDGSFTAASIDFQGRAIKWSHSWSNGTEVPIDGMENATIRSTVRGNNMDETMKIAGIIAETVHAVVSSDGKIMTTTVNVLANHPMGSMHNVLIFDKQ
jgi:hypothetical protein